MSCHFDFPLINMRVGATCNFNYLLFFFFFFFILSQVYKTCTAYNSHEIPNLIFFELNI